MVRWTLFGFDLSSGTVRIVLSLVVGSAMMAYGAFTVKPGGWHTDQPFIVVGAGALIFLGGLLNGLYRYHTL